MFLYLAVVSRPYCCSERYLSLPPFTNFHARPLAHHNLNKVELTHIPPPVSHRDRNRRKRVSGAQIQHVGNLYIIRIMGVYWLTQNYISSQNIGITYQTYHGINLPWLAPYHRTYLHCSYHGINIPWFSAFHRTSLLWLVSPHVRFSVSSLNSGWQGVQLAPKDLSLNVLFEILRICKCFL